MPHQSVSESHTVLLNSNSTVSASWLHHTCMFANLVDYPLFYLDNFKRRTNVLPYIYTLPLIVSARYHWSRHLSFLNLQRLKFMCSITSGNCQWIFNFVSTVSIFGTWKKILWWNEVPNISVLYFFYTVQLLPLHCDSIYIF